MTRNFNIAFLSLLVLFFMTATIRSGVQVISILLALFLLTYILIQKKKKTDIFVLEGDEKLLSFAFLSIALCALPPLLVNDSLSLSYRELNVVGEYLLFALVAFLMFKSRPQIKAHFLFLLIILASFLNGVISVAHLYVFPDNLYSGRLEGYIGINQYGLMCAVLCLFNGILFLFGQYKRWWCLSASLVSVIGVVGSGLRGVMIALICVFAVIVVLGFVKKYVPRQKLILSSLILLSSLAVFGYATLKTAPLDRLQDLRVETKAISEGNYRTSIGFRLQMYKEAVAMFRLSPIIGLSAKSALEKAEEIAEISKTTHILEFAQANRPVYGKRHNEVLNFMAKRGIIGLACLLFFYFAVMNICMKKRSAILSSFGLSLLMIYIGVGLSADPLMGHAESAFFALLLLFILMTTEGESSNLPRAQTSQG